MKIFEKENVKEKKKTVITKPFPGEFVLSQSMIDKFEHAKVMSASIKGFKKR